MIKLVSRIGLLFAIVSTSMVFSSNAIAAEPVSKWCDGVKIAAFPGGPPGGVFSNNVYNGIRQAELDLGPEVTYYYSDWDPKKLLSQLEDSVASKVDGIATYGYAGELETGPLVDKAFQQGTIVTTLNTSLSQSEGKYSTYGFGYVGAPNYSAGFALGIETIQRAGLDEGDVVFVWGLKSQGGDRGQRTIGVIESLEKLGVKVVYEEIDSKTNSDPDAGIETFVDVIKSNPDIKAVVTDHGGLTSHVGVFAEAASLVPGQLFFSGFDLSPSTIEAVRSGFQNLVLDQQPYLQGYLPILNICLTKKYGFSGLNINTAGAFVDSTNVEAIAALAEIEIR